MSLELIRESIKVNQVIGEESAQTVVENDIIVPDVKPDIANILLLDGDIFVDDTETMQDKMVVNGTIRYKILYISDEPSQYIKSINTSVNFSYEMDMLNTKQGMKSRAKCDIEHIDYNILNGRKVNVKSIVRVSGKVMDEIEQDIVNDLSGIENVQILRDNINVNCYLGANETDYTIRESMEIPAGKPAIKDILRSDVKIAGKDYKITDNKVIAKGELNISTLYVADDEEQSIQFMEHEIPFTQFIDLPGIDEDAVCEIEYQVADLRFEPGEDSDGELRVLNGEVTINIWAAGYRKRCIEVIEDAYSPYTRLSLDKKPFVFEDVVAETESQINLKDVAAIEAEGPEIAEVFNVLSKPVLSEWKVLDDKLVIEGVVNNNILYLADKTEQPVLCYNHEMPFKCTVDIKGARPDMGCDMGLEVEHCNYNLLSPNEVEIKLVIGVNVRVVSQSSFPLIVKVSEYPIEDKKLMSQPSITIYFSQPGDTLWKIAKKYYTTVDDVRRINNLGENDIITPGQQVIIPRRTM